MERRTKLLLHLKNSAILHSICPINIHKNNGNHGTLLHRKTSLSFHSTTDVAWSAAWDSVSFNNNLLPLPMMRFLVHSGTFQLDPLMITHNLNQQTNKEWLLRSAKECQKLMFPTIYPANSRNGSLLSSLGTGQTMDLNWIRTTCTRSNQQAQRKEFSSIFCISTTSTFPSAAPS